MKQKTTSDGTKGGLLKGKPHYDKNGQPLGGIKAVVTDAGGKPVELEGGEVIINKEASKKYWRELSRINQSAGNGVPIGPPAGADEDPEEYKDGGNIIEFNPNHVPNKWIVKYATEIKSKHPEIWKLGGNIFGNEAYKNLLRVSERGYWLDSEKWMYIKWRSYVARHKKDFRIEGVVAMLKWCDKVDKGWAYMKDLIDEKIKKIQEKSGWKHKSNTMKNGGNVSKTPAPASERIKGSKTNPKGTAKDAESGEKIKFDDNIVASIQSLIDEHNEKHPSKKISLAVAKAVVRRGMGAYSSSHRPTITGNKPNSRTAWGLARLKAFIYKAQTGKSKSGKYSQDNDLFEELNISVQKMNDGGNVDSNVLKVSKYVLERHPKKGDVIEGGKADGYEIKKLTKDIKRYGTVYGLWLLKGSTKRIVNYNPKTKTISNFNTRPFFTKKGEYYDTWNDKTIEDKMATGGNVFKDDRDGTTYFVEKRPDGIWTIFSEGPQWSRRDEYEYGFASEEDAIDIAKLHAGITTEDDPEAYFMRTQYGNGGELEKGIKAEYEHAKTISKFKREGVSTRDVAISIAKDHLKEDSKYYSKLEQMEGQKFEGGGLITNGGEANIGDTGILSTRKGDINIKITNITEKWVIFNDLNDGGKRKDNPVEKFIENYKGSGGISHMTPSAPIVTKTDSPRLTKIPASQGGSKKIKEKFEEPEVTFNPTLDYQKLFIDFLDKENTKHWEKISKTEFFTDIIQNFIEATDEIDGLSKESIKVLKESINE